MTVIICIRFIYLNVLGAVDDHVQCFLGHVLDVLLQVEVSLSFVSQVGGMVHDELHQLFGFFVEFLQVDVLRHVLGERIDRCLPLLGGLLGEIGYVGFAFNLCV